MNDKYWLALAMESRGGSFVVALAYAIKRADEHNYHIIRAAFTDLLAPYIKYAAELKQDDDRKP